MINKPQDIKPTKDQQDRMAAAFQGLDSARKTLATNMVLAFMRTHQAVDFRDNSMQGQLPNLAGTVAFVKTLDDARVQRELYPNAPKPYSEAQFEREMAEGRGVQKAVNAYEGHQN